MNIKIKMNKDLLLEKISLAARFVTTSFSSSPALQGILIKGEKKTINIFSTNLNSYFHTFLKVNNNYSFSFVIEPKKIIEYLTLISPGEVEIEVKEKQIIINCAKTKGSFPYIKVEEFPTPPEIKEKQQKIKTQFLIKNLPLVLFSVSSDDSRPVLSSVNFLTQEEKMTMVSTDGFRLSLLETNKEMDLPQVLIPASFLGEILRSMKNEKEVSFQYSIKEKMAVFSTEENNFYSRTIEGEFPPFEKVIPSETKTKIIVEKEELLRNIKIVSVFARDSSNIVVLSLKKGGLHLRPKIDDKGENDAYQEGEFEGEEQKIAFNFKFIIDLLNHFEAKRIKIEILRPDAPAVFKSDERPGYIHIIMPVRIQEQPA